MRNSSQMFEAAVSEVTSGKDPREKAVISLNTKICSFRRLWYSDRNHHSSPVFM